VSFVDAIYFRGRGVGSRATTMPCPCPTIDCKRVSALLPSSTRKTIAACLCGVMVHISERVNVSIIRMISRMTAAVVVILFMALVVG
jgi:hypothetical protein